MSAMPPIATELMHRGEMTRWAKSGCEQSQQGSPYSITSSARASSVGDLAAVMKARHLSALCWSTCSSYSSRSPLRSHIRDKPQPVGGVRTFENPDCFVRFRACGVPRRTERFVTTMALQAYLSRDRFRRHLRLCARHKRPHSCRATEQRDELASSHHSITSSARASSISGTSRPSALFLPLDTTTGTSLSSVCGYRTVCRRQNRTNRTPLACRQRQRIRPPLAMLFARLGLRSLGRRCNLERVRTSPSRLHA